jgi:spore coat protein U-like protein
MKSPRIVARIALVVLALATLFPSPTFANPQTNVAINVAVVADCTVSVAQALVFPNYQALTNPNPDTTTGTVNVQCSPGVGSAAHIGMGANLNPISDGYNYQMAGPNNTLLGYDLSFVNPGNTNITQISVPTTDGNVHGVTVYGYVGPGQNVPPGLYSDSVTILVSF